MTQVLEQKANKKKEKRWKKIIAEAKKELEESIAETKKSIIRKTAELLESNGMPLVMICTAISNGFREFEIDARYIRDCLDEKYKNPRMNRAQTAEVTTANGDKNVLEDTGSREVITSEESTSTQSGTPMSHNDAETTANTNQLQEDFQIQIRPEDYIIKDLPKYSSQLKDRIIIYLDGEVRRLRKQEVESH